jgi:beta-carotene/zeaxanthin 4-ketolase
MLNVSYAEVGGFAAQGERGMTTIRRFTNGLSTQIAIALMIIWAISLWKCVQIQIQTWHPILLLCLVAWQTWLYTGLFINAHDAMHGSIHSARKINQTIGQLCLWLYAGFDYPTLRAKHHLHHQHPASDRDPDFHDGVARNFWAWYWHFVREHLSWRQLGNLVLLSGIYIQICQFAIPNLVLFWIVPSLLSSIQLFYFGTFLPHREPIDGYVEPHRADTIDRSRWWSLITCYHFGYHREHHESPQTPWWKLARHN